MIQNGTNSAIHCLIEIKLFFLQVKLFYQIERDVNINVKNYKAELSSKPVRLQRLTFPYRSNDHVIPTLLNYWRAVVVIKMARRFYSIANTLNCAIFMDLRSSSALKRNISDLRTKYHDQSNVFTEDLIGVKEPMHLFDKWFREVSVNKDVEVNAMCLSTANQYI